jgi:hypothetical protein
MKKIFFILFSTLIGMMVLTTSCDKVEAPYMTEHAVVTGDTVRKLLLEDFTGHRCVNCPTAHKTIEDLQKIYGDRIVVMVIHTGFFANPEPPELVYDFTNPDGDAIGVFFAANQASLPKGMVNRYNNGSGYLLNPTAYGTAVSLVLDSMPKKPDIYIELKPSYSTNDSMVSVDVKLTALSSMPAGKYNLSVMILESDIIKPQKNNNSNIGATPIIHDYEHNNVLRGAINTTWGEEFSNTAISVGQTFTKTYSNYKIGSDWKPDNLKIVAFVYYADGTNAKVVIQAESIKLIK